MKTIKQTLGLAVGLALGAVTAWAQDTDPWFQQGRDAVEAAKTVEPVVGRAKNVILFVGDGMGVSTVTAARILEGQLRGEPGEENMLSFETLPYAALAKTYNTNAQTPDSAGTMTAMVTGVKTKEGVISLNERAIRGDCASAFGNEVSTIMQLAAEDGLATGVVSTARITHATPAANYAHAPDRNWEDDRSTPANQSAAGCADIASQLVDFAYGDGIQVALGGGRTYFMPETMEDPEYVGTFGRRRDGRDLIAEWIAKDDNAAYVRDQAQFDAIDPGQVSYLLGLFEPSHMQYEHDRPLDPAGEPSLSEMTAKAIDILARNDKGFYLHVESGRIDHAHHAGNAYRALTDTIEFANAIAVAMERTDPRETLIIVTADHSHVFTIAGYPTRGNDILGVVIGNDASGEARSAPSLDALGLPYTTLGYANGPGYTGASSSQPEGPKTFPHAGSSYTAITRGRPDLTPLDSNSAAAVRRRLHMIGRPNQPLGWDTAHPDFLQEATVPLSSETHAAEDVAVYALGPMAHLFRGVVEQHVVFHVMAEALGLH